MICFSFAYFVVNKHIRIFIEKSFSCHLASELNMKHAVSLMSFNNLHSGPRFKNATRPHSFRLAVFLMIFFLFFCSHGSQPPASPSTQEAIQGMLSMANLSSSDSLQQPWSNSQSKNSSQQRSNSHSAPGSKKGGGAGGGSGGGNNDTKRPNKRLPKKPRKSSSVESLDYDDEQDHMDACFKDSDYGES